MPLLNPRTWFKGKKSAIQSISQGYGGSGLGILGGGFSAGGRDWNREAGVRWDNSIVFAAIQYAVNAFLEVQPYVRRRKSDGTWEKITSHPVLDLLSDPNPWYDFNALQSGWIVSEICGRAGTSYTLKHRSSAGKLVGLEVIPHFAIWPFAAPGSGTFIDYYQVSIMGGAGSGYQRFAREDILEQRYGPFNHLRPQIAVGPLEACLLEVGTDKQAANYTAALLVNAGVTPHLISPAVKDINGVEILFGKAQIDQIQKTFEEKISGDNRGRPLISPIPIRVDDISMDPSQMNLEGIRNICEERVCAALRIPPGVLGMGTGLEHSNNRASSQTAEKQGARNFIKPYFLRRAASLTRGLIPELGEPGEEIYFPVDEIEALQEDKTETAKRDQIELSWTTVNEKRRAKGLPEVPNGNFFVIGSQTVDADSADDDSPSTTQAGPKVKRAG